MRSKLTPRFFQRDTTTVAQKLIGQRLVVPTTTGSRFAGRIVETEAYLGIEDPACHSYSGRRTARTEAMYLPGGHAYVYLIYGLHLCFNVVTRSSRHPEAVLIRALEPEEGLAAMRTRRGRDKDTELCSGPGKLCQALGITREHNGLSLSDSTIFIERVTTHPPHRHRLRR